MIVYRVERPGHQGLWYTQDGLLQPVVGSLGLTCAALPMEPDPDYRADGLAWHSGCSRLDDLLGWFSPAELTKLDPLGYRLFAFESTRVRDYGGHQVFSKDHLTGVTRFDLSYFANSKTLKETT